jgi:transcriptional regulator with XRE-family HTH domain
VGQGEKFKAEACPTCGTPRSVINGDWLRTQRTRVGFSLRDMATRLGYSASYLWDIEKNRRKCSPKIRKAYEAL